MALETMNRFTMWLRWAILNGAPRAVLAAGGRLFIADGGNDRVLIYNSIPTTNAAAADLVLLVYPVLEFHAVKFGEIHGQQAGGEFLAGRGL